MDFKEENFPVYQLLVRLNEPGVERAIADFERALTGGDEERFKFALGIQTIAANCTEETFPEMTKEMAKKTLQSCLEIFKDVASRGHLGGAYMVEDFRRRGFGEPDEPQALRLNGEDFPMYQFIKNNPVLTPGVLQKYEQMLQAGGDENNLKFAYNLEQVMVHFLHGAEEFPGMSREDVRKTFQAIRVVYEDLASKGNGFAVLLLAEYDHYGLGLPDKRQDNLPPKHGKPKNFNL